MNIDNKGLKPFTKEDEDSLLQTGISLIHRLNDGDNRVLEYIELIVQTLNNIGSHTYAATLQDALDYYGSIENDTNVIDIFLIAHPKEEEEGHETYSFILQFIQIICYNI